MVKVQKYIEDHNEVIWIAATIVLCVIAFLEYSCRWTWDASLVNDEFQSASTAINLSQGKGFIRSDRPEVLASYTRGWPASILLAGWIKIFGTSEVACRSLSTVYGVLAVFSVVYITRRMFKDLGYTLLTSLMFIAEAVCREQFAQCRMYSLEILLGIWLYYCIYQAINRQNPWKKEDKCSVKKAIFRECIDFHWGYVAIAFILLVLCFETHVNSAIPLGGVACYVIIQAFRNRKKKYIVLTGVGIVGGGVCLANYLYYRVTGDFFVMHSIFDKFVYYAASVNVQWDYLTYILKVTGAVAMSVICLLLIVVTGIKEKHLDDKIIYLMCLVIFTVVFFVFFSSGRYTFHDRYIIILVPFAVALFTYAYIPLKKWNMTIGFIIWICIVLHTGFSIGKDIHIHFTTQNVNTSNMDYIEAYSKIGEYYDLQTETVPIAGRFMRSYYYEHVLQDFVYGNMDNKVTAFNIWRGFAEEYPEGIVTVEQIKLELMERDFPLIINNWTDRLSGPGIDNTNVNVSHYNFLYECSDRLDESIKEVLYSDNTNNLKSYFMGDKLWINVPRSVLERENAPADPEIIFIDVCFDVSGDNVERYFQLCLPEDISRMDHFVYEIDVKQMRNISTDDITGALIDQSNMAIYGNDYLQEYFIDETTGDNNNHTAL